MKNSLQVNEPNSFLGLIKKALFTFTLKGQVLAFLIEFLFALIIVQLIILLNIKEGRLYSILSEGLAPNKIGLLTFVIGVRLMYLSGKSFKKKGVFGSLSQLAADELWIRDTLIGLIVALLAIRAAGLIIMHVNSLPLPEALSYQKIWVYFLCHNVIAFISLCLMLRAPFIDFEKRLQTSNPTFHKILLGIYIALGCVIFTIPLLGSTWK